MLGQNPPTAVKHDQAFKLLYAAIIRRYSPAFRRISSFFVTFTQERGTTCRSNRGRKCCGVLAYQLQIRRALVLMLTLPR